MGRKRTPGLYKRNGIWHIDKQYRGIRICESTGEYDLKEAEEYLLEKMQEVKQAKRDGVTRKRSFREAATRYLRENVRKRSIFTEEKLLKQIMPHIGHLPLDEIYKDTFRPFIEEQRAKGLRAKTINLRLAVVRQVLDAATEWRDEYNRKIVWLRSAPKIKPLKRKEERADARKPYPLSWEEQARLLKELPPHLERMVLFAVNTGCRDGEVCGLRWDWEISIPTLETSVFIIPEEVTKNGEERLIVLNRVAKRVIEEVRGQHPEYVLTYQGHQVRSMNNSAWQRGWRKAGLPVTEDLSHGVHNLRHTFGRRLRAAGVSFEDRQDLLGHTSGRITTHYSQAEIQNLIEAANKACEQQKSRKSPALVILRRGRG